MWSEIKPLFGWRAPARASSLLLALVLVVIAGCVTDNSRGRGWDPDAEILPLRERQDQGQRERPGLRSHVVLLASDDGTVGEVVVTTPTGTAVLNREREGVEFANPGEILELSPEQVERSQRGTLPAEPASAVSFVAYFEHGSDRITDETREAWSRFLTAIRRRDVPEASVKGHADRSGTEKRNEALSRQRAQAVRDELVAAGVDPELIELAWYGESSPAVPTADGVREKRNRRVEIRIR